MTSHRIGRAVAAASLVLWTAACGGNDDTASPGSTDPGSDRSSVPQSGATATTGSEPRASAEPDSPTTVAGSSTAKPSAGDALQVDEVASLGSFEIVNGTDAVANSGKIFAIGEDAENQKLFAVDPGTGTVVAGPPIENFPKAILATGAGVFEALSFPCEFAQLDIESLSVTTLLQYPLTGSFASCPVEFAQVGDLVYTYQEAGTPDGMGSLSVVEIDTASGEVRSTDLRQSSSFPFGTEFTGVLFLEGTLYASLVDNTGQNYGVRIDPDTMSPDAAVDIPGHLLIDDGLVALGNQVVYSVDPVSLAATERPGLLGTGSTLNTGGVRGADGSWWTAAWRRWLVNTRPSEPFEESEALYVQLFSAEYELVGEATVAVPSLGQTEDCYPQVAGAVIDQNLFILLSAGCDGAFTSTLLQTSQA